MKAIRKGCSKAIMSQVSASGPQKRNILRYVSFSGKYTISESHKYTIIDDENPGPAVSL